MSPSDFCGLPCYVAVAMGVDCLAASASLYSILAIMSP